MTNHERDLFFETLELLRRIAYNHPDAENMEDWKIDAGLFRRLHFTVGDLNEIYAGRDITVYANEAIEGPSPVCPTYDELEPFIGVTLTCVERQDKTVMVVAEVPGKPVLLTNGDCPDLGSIIGQHLRLGVIPCSGTEPASICFWGDGRLLYCVTEAG